MYVVSSQSLLFRFQSQEKKKAQISEILISYFNQYDFASKIFNQHQLPDGFVKISEWIRHGNETEIQKYVVQIKKIFQHLENFSTKKEIIEKKGDNYYAKCLNILFLQAEYLCNFYKFDWDENGELRSLEKKQFGLEHLKYCLQSIQDYEQQLKYSCLDAVPQADAQSLFASSGKVGLDRLGGQERHSTVSRLFSREMAGIFGYGLGSEATNFGHYIHLPQNMDSPVINQAIGLGVSNILMMASFGMMLSASDGIGYKMNLNCQLLSDVLDSVLDNPEEKEKLKRLSLETRKTLRGYLNEKKHLSALGFVPGKLYGVYEPTNIPEDPSELIWTSMDFRKIILNLLKKQNLSYEDVCSSLHQIPPEEHPNFIHMMTNHVEKIKSQWGTFLDHILLKLNDVGKEQIINDLKDGQSLFSVPWDFNNPINYELEGCDGAAQTVQHVLRTTSWEKRIQGTREFGWLQLSIASSKLSDESICFLLQMYLGKELQGKERGEFAAGKERRSNQKTKTGVASLYTLTSIASFVSSFFATPVAVTIIKAVCNAIGAMTFGCIGLYPQIGMSDAHLSKQKMLQEMLNYFERKTEQQNDPEIETLKQQIFLNEQIIELEKMREFTIPKVYDLFLAQMELLQKLGKKRKIEGESFEEQMRIISMNLQHFACFFTENHVAEFVFEFNHAKKDCPLFEIIHFYFMRKGMSLAEKRMGFILVGVLVNKIYKEANEKQIDLINASIGALPGYLDENVFQIFLAQGYRKAKSSKAKFLFTFQAIGLIAQAERQNKAGAKNFLKILKFAMRRACGNRSSLLYGLQFRLRKTYMKMRTLMRAASDISTVGLFSILVALSSVPATSVFGVVGLALLTAGLYSLDFGGRKFMERLEVKTRFHFAGIKLKKAYRNYEISREYLELDKTPESDEPLTLKEVFQKLNHIDWNQSKIEVKKEFLRACSQCLTWEKQRDNFRVFELGYSQKHEDPKVLVLSEMEMILKEGLDKYSLVIIFLRIVRILLVFPDHILCSHDKKEIFAFFTFRLLASGELAHMIKTKNMFGYDQYLMADMGLGFLVGSLGLIMAIPQLHDVYQSIDAQGHITQNLSQFLAQVGTQMTLDTIGFIGWIHEVDISQYGATNTYKNLMSLSKKILTLLE